MGLKSKIWIQFLPFSFATAPNPLRTFQEPKYHPLGSSECLVLPPNLPSYLFIDEDIVHCAIFMGRPNKVNAWAILKKIDEKKVEFDAGVRVLNSNVEFFSAKLVKEEERTSV